MFKSSKMMQRWFLKMNQFSILTTFLRSLGSVSLSLLSILTSTLPWIWNRFLFRMILMATSLLYLWSMPLTTCPNEPLPRLNYESISNAELSRTFDLPVNDLVPVCNMLIDNELVVIVIVIKLELILFVELALNCFCIQIDVVDGLVLHDFVLLVLSQIVA